MSTINLYYDPEQPWLRDPDWESNLCAKVEAQALVDAGGWFQSSRKFCGLSRIAVDENGNRVIVAGNTKIIDLSLPYAVFEWWRWLATVKPLRGGQPNPPIAVCAFKNLSPYCAEPAKLDGTT